MSEIVLNAELRDKGRKHARRSRAKGLIPGVFYSRNEDNVSIQVPTLSLSPLIYTSETNIVDLRLKDGSSRKCILRDVQFDPVSDKPVHFDLQGLRENEELTIAVPVVLIGGPAKGVKDGGMIQHVIHKISVSCLPKYIPERIEVNVADMDINDSVHVKDLNIPNVTVLERPESTVVVLMPPVVVKEAEPEVVAEEAIAEPEVVGKGKKAEEDEGEEEKETREGS